MRILIILSFLVFSGCLRDVLAETPLERIDRLRGEIDSLSIVMNEIERNEKNLAEQVPTLDRQISTRVRLLNELENESKRERTALKTHEKNLEQLDRRMKDAKRELNSVANDVEQLENLIRKRAVFVYKHGVHESLRYLLAATNPGDLLRRRVYIRKIQERDQRNLENLRAARQQQAGLTLSLIHI